ncbi:MAG: FAD-binding protein, partial [Clostridia bacterium]|nr:FAD-binding protein [Clostridia bacterium]
MSKTLLIVGAGLAGLSAAYTCAKAGHRAVLVSAMPSERAQSVMAEGGINASLNTRGEQDSPDQHCADTLKAACGLADPTAVAGMTEAAPQIVRELSAMGVCFNRFQGDIDLRNFGGQKKKRTAFCQSDTGKQIMTALIDAVRRFEAEGLVERRPHHLFLRLQRANGCACGMEIQDAYTGETAVLQGDAALIATGGMHGLFQDTTGSCLNTGAAAAQLFSQGVEMANLEFVQFHPTTARHGRKRFLITEAARGEGGRLMVPRDGKPYYFMEEKYPELGNLMPRDVTAREIWNMQREGQVYLTLTHLDEAVFTGKLSGLVSDCATFLNLDIRSAPIPVTPGIHYVMGGIRVDAQHRTSVPHLYAAGECCAQYHGANRLGGNSLLGAIYGGRVAAQTALAEATAPEGARILDGDPVSDAPFPHADTLLRAMGVVRDEATLSGALETLQTETDANALLARAML